MNLLVRIIAWVIIKLTPKRKQPKRLKSEVF